MLLQLPAFFSAAQTEVAYKHAVCSDQGARYGSEQNCITSKLLAISGVALVNLGTDVLSLGDNRVRVSRRRIVREVRSPASRDGVTAVYFFEARSINFANVVYSVSMHVEVDLH